MCLSHGPQMMLTSLHQNYMAGFYSYVLLFELLWSLTESTNISVQHETFYSSYQCLSLVFSLPSASQISHLNSRVEVSFRVI